MDGKRFDRFTRLMVRDTTRRSIIWSSAGGLMAGLLGIPDAEAKKRKKRKKKKCKRPPCGPCTVSADGVSLVVSRKFKKKPLRLQQRTNFGNGSRQTEITYKGKSVLKINYEISPPGMNVTVTYGAAFSGINQARFSSDGTTITGEIDGRAIAPLPVGSAPGQIAFADGGPALEVQGNAKLLKAIQGLFSKAGALAASCQPSQNARSVSAEEHFLSSIECIAKQGKCVAEGAKCEADVAALAASTCTIVPFIGPIVCGIIGTVNCAYELASCSRRARYSSTCCPVRCGGDVEDLDGPNPLCCEPGETCQDPNSNEGRCCPAGMVSCGGDCCPAGQCTSGFCCTTGVGTICGNQCCGPLSSCCGGRCCAGVCNGNICCVGGELPCGSGCCNGTCCNNSCCPTGQVCCNNVCCPSGYTCQNNQCVQVCNPGEVPCAGACCTGGQQCYRCPNGAQVCRFGPCIN
jgi:hypothetical protein